MDKEISIIINSCDEYKDTWKPFFESFTYFWKDCNFKKFLLTNTLDFDHPGCEVIKCGENKIWTERLRQSLEYVKTDYVLLFLDDHWLKSQVDTNEIYKYLKLAQKYDAGCLRLKPGTSKLINIPDNDLIGKISKKKPYNVSTLVAIWNTETLKKLTNESWNPWEFEKKGSIISEKLKRDFYSVYNTVIETHNAIVRSKWIKEVINEVNDLDINVDISRGFYDKSLKNTYQIKKLVYRLDFLDLREVYFYLNKIYYNIKSEVFIKK